jgi:hypothetical protein
MSSSLILSNSDKSLVIANKKKVSLDILKLNKLDYLIKGRMESDTSDDDFTGEGYRGEPDTSDTSDDDFTGEVEGEEIYYQGAGRFKDKDKTVPIPETNLTDVLLLSDDALEIMLKNLDIGGIKALEKSNKKIYNRLQQQPFKEIIEKKQLVEFLKKNGIEEDYSKVTHLNIGPKGIKRIPPFFKYLTSITWLYLYDNNIKKIENLPNSITWLHLGSNQITKIENLPNSLTTLYLWNNNIIKIENLPPSLTKLYLWNNKIIKIENLPPSLTKLNLESNQITKIENLPNSLIQLFIADNQITEIENLPTSLTKLNIARNPITNKTYKRPGLTIEFN